MLTPYHAKYFVHELAKRCPSDSIKKLASTFVDAQVDLNPHPGTLRNQERLGETSPSFILALG